MKSPEREYEEDGEAGEEAHLRLPGEDQVATEAREEARLHREVDRVVGEAREEGHLLHQEEAQVAWEEGEHQLGRVKEELPQAPEVLVRGLGVHFPVLNVRHLLG